MRLTIRNTLMMATVTLIVMVVANRAKSRNDGLTGPRTLTIPLPNFSLSTFGINTDAAGRILGRV